MSAHTVTIEFEPMGPTAEMTCTAPADADCRRRYDCDCVTWFETGIEEDGRPYHVVGDWSERHHDDRHYGTFDPEWCNEVEWFDAADGLDNTTGTVTFTVESEWDDDHFTWHAGEVTA